MVGTAAGVAPASELVGSDLDMLVMKWSGEILASNLCCCCGGEVAELKQNDSSSLVSCSFDIAVTSTRGFAPMTIQLRGSVTAGIAWL